MDAIWKALGRAAPANGAGSRPDEERSRERRMSEVRALLAEIAVSSTPPECAEPDESDSSREFCCA